MFDVVTLSPQDDSVFGKALRERFCCTGYVKIERGKETRYSGHVRGPGYRDLIGIAAVFARLEESYGPAAIEEGRRELAKLASDLGYEPEPGESPRVTAYRLGRLASKKREQERGCRLAIDDIMELAADGELGDGLLCDGRGTIYQRPDGRLTAEDVTFLAPAYGAPPPPGARGGGGGRR